MAVVKFNPHQEEVAAESEESRTWFPGPAAALSMISQARSFETVSGKEGTASWISDPREQVLRTQVGQNQELALTEPVTIPRKAYFVDERFQMLQKWQCVVLRIASDETFRARLIDQTETSGIDEEAEFLQSDIAEADKPLFKEGAAFYWSIGYRNTLDGQLQRVSELRFRRLPAWSKKEIVVAKQDVHALKVILDKYSSE